MVPNEELEDDEQELDDELERKTLESIFGTFYDDGNEHVSDDELDGEDAEVLSPCWKNIPLPHIMELAYTTIHNKHMLGFPTEKARLHLEKDYCDHCISCYQNALSMYATPELKEPHWRTSSKLPAAGLPKLTYERLADSPSIAPLDQSVVDLIWATKNNQYWLLLQVDAPPTMDKDEKKELENGRHYTATVEYRIAGDKRKPKTMYVPLRYNADWRLSSPSLPMENLTPDMSLEWRFTLGKITGMNIGD